MLPRDVRLRSLAQQWLVWQVAGLGPMHGQAHHFVRYAPEGQSYGVERYTREARRLLEVLEYRLRQVEYLAEDFSVADIACFPWVGGSKLIGVDLAELPAVKRWWESVGSRPAAKRAASAIMDENRASYTQTRAVLTPEQWSNMFGDRMHAAARAR